MNSIYLFLHCNNMTCPICYSDGLTSGIVIPTSCIHSLCLSCYSNHIILNKRQCPVCRTMYNIDLVNTRHKYVNLKFFILGWHIYTLRLQLD